MTTPDTERLRKLADAATPGPWSHADYGDPNPEHWPVGLIETDGEQETWVCDTALAMSEPDAKFIAAAREAVPALLDRIARLEAQSDIRGRAVVIYRDRAREAEARVKAVQDLIDQADTAGDWTVTCSRLQWAIDNAPTIEHQETA